MDFRKRLSGVVCKPPYAASGGTERSELMWLNRKNLMNREVHIRFWENAGVKLPCVTRLAKTLRLLY